MEIHHTKHHQAYCDKTNAALEGTEFEEKPIEEVLKNLNALPENIRNAVRNNGGGFCNHNLFWKVLSPDGARKPTGELAESIKKSFGDFDSFKEEFSKSAATQFGSGWTWLVSDENGLSVVSTPNQDTPLSKGKTALLCLDIWEHAYY